MKMKHKILITALVGVQVVTLRAQNVTYALDNGSISGAFNASEGTETLDNWFGNVFTATGGQNLISAVDFGVYTTSPNSSASVSIYQVTGAGGNPALGANLLYTQSFTPLTGDGTNAFLQQISLSSPVTVNAGEEFLVSILIHNVIAASPNDVYPFLLDTSGSSAGSFWDRSAPNTFNLNDLSGAVLVSDPLTPGGFAPGDDHIIIRAEATVVPEPATFALAGIGLAALIGFKRRNS